MSFTITVSLLDQDIHTFFILIMASLELIAFIHKSSGMVEHFFDGPS
jgi:hypothetical protein